MSRLDAGVLEPSFTGPLQRLLQRIETALPAPRARRAEPPGRADPGLGTKRFILLERLVTSSPTPCGTRRAARWRRVPSSRRIVRINVLDSGPGIPLELRRDIFSEFYKYRAGRPEPGCDSACGSSSAVPMLAHTVELESRPDQDWFLDRRSARGRGVEQEGVESRDRWSRSSDWCRHRRRQARPREHAESTGNWAWHVVTYASAAEGLKTFGSSERRRI